METEKYISEIDKARMAGFIGGEGCITISCQVRKNRPNPSHRVFINASNTNISPLEFFVKNYGGKLYSVHERRKDKNNANKIKLLTNTLALPATTHAKKWYLRKLMK